MATKGQAKERQLTSEEELYQLNKELQPLLERQKQLRSEVYEEYVTHGTRRGRYFTIALKKTLKVAEPELAFRWAAERNCLLVDTTKAMQILRREFRIPHCFTVQETQYLRMRSESHNETNHGDDS